MNIKLTSKGARIPQRAENGAAGYDLFVPRDSVINPGRNLIPLDIQIELPHGTEGQIRPRSGFALKGMEGYSTMQNSTPRRFNADVILGTIDESYRGTVGIIVKSFEERPFVIKAGAKIAHMVISKYESEPFFEVSELTQTERGAGGFGHTGTM